MELCLTSSCLLPGSAGMTTSIVRSVRRLSVLPSCARDDVLLVRITSSAKTTRYVVFRSAIKPLGKFVAATDDVLAAAPFYLWAKTQYNKECRRNAWTLEQLLWRPGYRTTLKPLLMDGE